MFRVLLILSVLASLTVGQAPTVMEDEVLVPSGATANEIVGSVLALDGDLLIAGAPNRDRAWVWRRDGDGAWLEESVLAALDSVDQDFGRAVDGAGDRIAVGAPLAGGGGAVYVFESDGSTWTQNIKLLTPDSTASYFGGAVALDANRLYVGAPNDSQAGNLSGAVFVFLRVGALWLLEQKLTASDAAAKCQFGTVLHVSDEQLLVGAEFDDAEGNNAGAIYTFRLEGGVWTEQQKLTRAGASAGDYFGCSMDVDDSHLLVGAKGGGLATLFAFDGATWQQEHEWSYGGSSAYFGSSVGIRGDVVAIGASHDQAGRVVVYRFTGEAWVEERFLVPSIPSEPGDDFGHTLAMYDKSVLVGVPRNDAAGPNFGGLHLFHAIPTWENLKQGFAGSFGIPFLLGSGSLEGGSSVPLELSHLLPGASVYLVVGASLLEAQFHLGTMVPFPHFIVPGIPSGAGQVTLFLPWPTGLPSGAPVYFQCWLQDPAGLDGWAGSNAISGTTP